MGILNLTPDSFYDGNQNNSLKQVLTNIERMILQGATIIDIGAVSSRPNSIPLSSEEELNRLKPFLSKIISTFGDSYFSIDSYRKDSIQYALDQGIHIVNDISGGIIEPQILELVGTYKVPYILMHMQGTPTSMQLEPNYDNILGDILYFLSERMEVLKQHNIKDIIIDVGFGFGKSLNDNYHLLKNLNYFKSLNCPILTGISRKSMIYQVLNSDANNALNGTSALHFEALRQGSQILRVHDVKAAKEVIELYNIYQAQ